MTCTVLSTWDLSVSHVNKGGKVCRKKEKVELGKGRLEMCMQESLGFNFKQGCQTTPLQKKMTWE